MKRVLDSGEAAGDQGEQIARLRKRVLPEREVPAAPRRADLDQIAVGKQHRTRGLIGLDPHAVARHDVGPIGEIGDLAKALRLALRAEHAIGDIEALERRVRLGSDPHRGLEGERRGHVVDDEMIIVDLVAIAAERLAIEREPDQLQLLAVQHQRPGASACRRIAPHREARPHLGRRRLEIEPQLDLIDQIIGRPVVLEPNRLRRFRPGLSFRLGFGHARVLRMWNDAYPRRRDWPRVTVRQRGPRRFSAARTRRPPWQSAASLSRTRRVPARGRGQIADDARCFLLALQGDQVGDDVVGLLG